MKKIRGQDSAMIEFATSTEAQKVKSMTENEVVAGRNLQVSFYESKYLRAAKLEEHIDRVNFDHYKKQRVIQKHHNDY